MANEEREKFAGEWKVKWRSKEFDRRATEWDKKMDEKRIMTQEKGMTKPDTARCICGNVMVKITLCVGGERVSCVDDACWQGPVRHNEKDAIESWNMLMSMILSKNMLKEIHYERMKLDAVMKEIRAAKAEFPQ